MTNIEVKSIISQIYMGSVKDHQLHRPNTDKISIINEASAGLSFAGFDSEGKVILKDRQGNRVDPKQEVLRVAQPFFEKKKQNDERLKNSLYQGDHNKEQQTDLWLARIQNHILQSGTKLKPQKDSKNLEHVARMLRDYFIADADAEGNLMVRQKGFIDGYEQPLPGRPFNFSELVGQMLRPYIDLEATEISDLELDRRVKKDVLFDLGYSSLKEYQKDGGLNYSEHMKDFEQRVAKEKSRYRKSNIKSDVESLKIDEQVHREIFENMALVRMGFESKEMVPLKQQAQFENFVNHLRESVEDINRFLEISETPVRHSTYELNGEIKNKWTPVTEAELKAEKELERKKVENPGKEKTENISKYQESVKNAREQFQKKEIEPATV